MIVRTRLKLSIGQRRYKDGACIVGLTLTPTPMASLEELPVGRSVIALRPTASSSTETSPSSSSSYVVKRPGYVRPPRTMPALKDLALWRTEDMYMHASTQRNKQVTMRGEIN